MEGEPAPLGSRSPTPPPASQAKATLAASQAKATLADHLAELAVEQDATESDETAVPVAARRASHAGKDSRKSGTVKGKGRVVPVPKRPRDTITVEDSDEEPERKSRHKSVEGSKIYKEWEGPLLSEVRRRFTSLIAARDGYPLRFGVTFREMNFKLALQAAKDVMPKPQFTSFKAQMEAAFKDPSKE